MLERSVLLAAAAIGAMVLVGCYWGESEAPQRSFTPGDLLVGLDSFPTEWQRFEPYVPSGDDLCTTECAAVQYTMAEANSPGPLATQSVYRYLSTRIAQRTFDKVFLAQERSLEAVSSWTFKSSVADQAHFGCRTMAGNVGQVCVWGGRYEEFIVVFRTQIGVADMSLSALEAIVRATDAMVASHLGHPASSATSAP